MHADIIQENNNRTN